MNILSSFLFILSLIECTQAVLYAGDLEVYWQMPDDGTAIRSFKTTLAVPLHMATTIYQDSIHGFRQFISTNSSQSMVNIMTDDGLYRTYNVTRDDNGEILNSNPIYPGDNITYFWSLFPQSSTYTTCTDSIIIQPGIYGIGNRSDASGYQLSHTWDCSADDVFTKLGFDLFLYGQLWSFGDLVWHDTEIFVTGERSNDWCFNYNVTQLVGPVYNESPVPLPNVTVHHAHESADIYNGPDACVLDEIRMIQPSEDAYVPGKGWDDLYGDGTPNPYY